MIYNSNKESLSKNFSKKSYFSLLNKTRVESLNDRIHKANELINSFVEKTKFENFKVIPEKSENQTPKKENDNVNNIKQMIEDKSVQVSEEKLKNNENEIINENSDTNNLNNNSEEKKEDAMNNNEEIKENENIENNNENIEKNNENIDENNKKEKNMAEIVEKNNNINKEEDNAIENENNLNSNTEKNETQNNNLSNILSSQKIEETDMTQQKKEFVEIKEEIDIPFIKRTKLLLLELKKLKQNSSIKEEDINTDIETALPNRSIIELSLSDMRSKKKLDILQKKLLEKDKYIKDLESIIYKERKENMRLKKSENANLLKISALEDQLRVLKNKFLSHHAKTEINPGFIYGEKMIKNIRDNILENKNSYNNGISDYNSNLTFNNTKSIKSTNRNSFYKNKWEAPWLSQSYKNINNINNINNKYPNMNSNGGQNNFQRVSEMILDNTLNNNKIRNMKNIYGNNYGNNFNRYSDYRRYGNGNNNF